MFFVFLPAYLPSNELVLKRSIRKAVISPGDSVKVDSRVGGYLRGHESATVLNWTPSGRIKVKLDKKGMVKLVSPEYVKKIADKPL
ncbi:hypothetical protein [Spirosoma litoris]